MRITVLLLAGAALAAATPAAAQAGRNCSLVLQEQVRPRSRADVARDSVRNAIRDTLYAALLQAARGAGIAEPAGIVLVERIDRHTGEARVWSFRSNVPDSVSQAAVARHAALLARWPDRTALTNFRLDAREFPDEHTMECLPSIENLPQFRQELGMLAMRFMNQTRVRPRMVVHVRMLVSREGVVAYAEVMRGSLYPEWDWEVRALTERLRFQPALRDGVPVDVWVEQPVRVQLPSAGGR